MIKADPELKQKTCKAQVPDKQQMAPEQWGKLKDLVLKEGKKDPRGNVAVYTEDTQANQFATVPSASGAGERVGGECVQEILSFVFTDADW